MATIDLGKIAITPEGQWSYGKYYEKLSLVIFNGQSYLSLRDTTGDNPETSRSDWMQITSRGESLYQMMVREGKFVGTEEEFLQQYLDSLKACADASEEVRAALSDILDEMDRVRAEISEVMVEEDIRIKNEAKREAAEINRRNAEITRGVEERNRQEAEQRREQSMQQIQNDAEIALAMAAEAQQKAEEAILNEEERVKAENQRKIDEATRIQSEEQRVNDEAMRRSREADRQESENIRQKNEGDRILAEREREEIMRNLVEELKALAANRFKIVDVLPEVGEFAVIYLVPSTTPSDNDVYDEWAYVSEKWEHIGSTRFEMDNYFTKEEVEAALDTKANIQHQHTVADITDFPELYYDATAFFTSGAYPSDKYEELLEAVRAKRTVYATIDEEGHVSYVFFMSSANSDGSSSRVLLTTIFADGGYLYINTFVLQQSGMTPLQESITGKADKATTLAGYGIGDAYTKSEVDTALEGKQDTLTAGNGISIEGNVISSSVAEVVDNIVNAGYVFAGVATPATDPSTPNAKVFYIANGKGTYEKFGGIEVTEDEVVVLKYDTAWHKVATGIASDEKLSELDIRTEDIRIEGLSNESDGPDEIQFNNDDDTESYVKIGQYGIKAKGFYDIDGKPISISTSNSCIDFSDGEDITLALEALISNGGDVNICGYGIAYIHKPIKISQNHTHIHISSNATLKLTDSLIDSYTPGNPIWMFYTPGSLYYWDDSRVRTETLEDILIEGGTLDFNGYYKNLMTSGNILAEFVGISIVDVDCFVLRNCTLLGASSFCTMFAGLHGFHIYDCAIHTTGGSHDGIHFHGDLMNGIIENLTGETTGDDFVGLNTGGDFWKGWMEESNVVRKGDSSNITIRNLPKGCNVRLLNGKTHSLSGVVLENVPKFSITCYGEDAYYKDITIRGRSVDNTYYVEASNCMPIFGGVDTYSHTIHIETLTIDSCLARNTSLMLLSNANIKNLVINGMQYYAEPTSGQLSHPDFTGLFPLIKTSNKYLQGDDFKATSVMGQSTVERLYLNNCFINDTRKLKKSNGEEYGVKIPAIINTDTIGRIFISNSDITVAKICVPDAQVINSASSIINID